MTKEKEAKLRATRVPEAASCTSRSIQLSGYLLGKAFFPLIRHGMKSNPLSAGLANCRAGPRTLALTKAAAPLKEALLASSPSTEQG